MATKWSDRKQPSENAGQVAITATDLAEIIGSATAMYLLFGLPLWVGVLITAADVLFILFFGTHNFRLLEVGCSVRVGCRVRVSTVGSLLVPSSCSS